MNFVPFSKYSTKKELYGSRNSKIKEDKKKKKKKGNARMERGEPIFVEKRNQFSRRTSVRMQNRR